MKIVLVTGASRGLGLEVCRQLALQGNHVYMGTRDPSKGEKVLAALGSLPGKIEPFLMDYLEPDLESRVVKHFQSKHGRLDILVNNAGHFPGGAGSPAPAVTASIDVVRDTLETNTLWPMRFCQAVIPLMKQHRFGRIVNVSSGMGQLSEMASGYPAYRISKTALNAVTKIFSDEAKGNNVLVNSVCPGWVRTDMGGSNAPRSVEQGAFGIVWAATLPDDGPTGGFFRDGKPLSW